MQIRHHISITLLLVLTLLSGCSLLTGKGGGVFIPPYDEIESPTQEQGEEPSEKTPSHPTIPLTDGFDFPVGDRNGRGWSVTGYRFLQWSNYSNSWHPGEDWNIPGAGNGDWREPVYSIANGIVVFSDWNTALGNVVLIEHHLPNGAKVWSQYAHLDKRMVQKGDIVARRQQVGTVGRGPNHRFAAHLHFEIRKQPLPANAWPRTGGQPWIRSRVLEFWIHPSQFIQANRP